MGIGALGFDSPWEGRATSAGGIAQGKVARSWGGGGVVASTSDDTAPGEKFDRIWVSALAVAKSCHGAVTLRSHRAFILIIVSPMPPPLSHLRADFHFLPFLRNV